MKKTLFSAALAAAFGLVAMQASASDGQINFTGKVTASNCIVTGGAGTGGETKNISVKLDPVSTAAFAAAGDTAMDHTFTLKFGGTGSTGCTNGTVVSLNFDATVTPSGFASSMVNTATGNLKNVTGDYRVVQEQVGV